MTTDPQSNDLRHSSGGQARRTRERSGGYPGQLGEVVGGALESLADQHILDYVRVLYKRRWPVLTVFLVIVGVVAVQTFTTIPVYEARLRLLIESENPNYVDFREVIEQVSDQGAYHETQYNILRSRTLVRRTLDRTQYWQHPEFTGEGQPKPVTLGRLLAAVTSASARVISLLPRIWQESVVAEPGPSATDIETAKQSQIVNNFLGKLMVLPVPGSRLVDLTFRGSDPEFVMTVVNTLGRTYIEQSLEFKFLASREASAWLGQQIDDQRQQLEASEVTLQNYREDENAISLEENQDIVVSKLFDLNGAVTQARTRRIEKETWYNQLVTLESNGEALDTFPAISTNTYIQQIKTELTMLETERTLSSVNLGDRHPDMIRLNTSIAVGGQRLAAEIDKVAQAIRNDFIAARAEESGLLAALEEQKLEALVLNRKAIEYGVLQRSANTDRALFESLLVRAGETGVSEELRTSNIRIIDEAEAPRAPVLPRTRLNLLLAIVTGGGLAVGVGFLLEYFDNRIKTPNEVKNYLKLPFLGFVPVTPDGVVPLSLQGSDVPADFGEAFRLIRTNLLFSSAQDGPRSLLITSTAPQEGKSIVSGNLALGLAHTGLRVLLVDADMRRPSVHKYFNLSLEPGLSNLLVGDAKSSEVIQQLKGERLWTMTAGRNVPDPTELLGSQRFEELVGSLANQFDWVILDSPPVMAVSDPSVAAHTVTDVLFVVGAEMVARAAARTAVGQLRSVQANIIGAVLNRVNLKRDSYYYAEYYHRDYEKYYVSSARSPAATGPSEGSPDQEAAHS